MKPVLVGLVERQVLPAPSDPPALKENKAVQVTKARLDHQGLRAPRDLPALRVPPGLLAQRDLHHLPARQNASNRRLASLLRRHPLSVYAQVT